MGEFQCYKFRTVSRALTSSERQEVEALSSRGHVTNTSATFMYNYSYFRHSIESVLANYFDIALYFSNWGTKQLLFRLPKSLVNKKDLTPYLYESEWGSYSIELISKGDYYLLNLYLNDEDGGGWADEGDYDIGNFESIYHDLLDGDYRSLYLLLLSGQTELYSDEDDSEEAKNPSIQLPPIPPNLGKLSASLQNFMNFFLIDEDLVTAVQSFSPSYEAAKLDYEILLQQLSKQERIDWLSRLLAGEVQLKTKLQKHLEKINPDTAVKPITRRVSISEIKNRQLEIENKQHLAAIAARKAEHEQKMQDLIGQEDRLWQEVYHNIDLKNAKGYDKATNTLKDLQALAKHQNKLAQFKLKMMELKAQAGRRHSLLKRWQVAGLIAN